MMSCSDLSHFDDYTAKPTPAEWYTDANSPSNCHTTLLGNTASARTEWPCGKGETHTQTTSASSITHTRFIPHYPGLIFVKQPQEKCVCMLVCICVSYSLTDMFGHIERKKKNQEYKEDIMKWWKGDVMVSWSNILEDGDDCGS